MQFYKNTASLCFFLLLIKNVACEKFCYFGQGLNSTSDNYLSISSFRLGSICIIAMQSNGFWAANSVEHAKTTKSGFWAKNPIPTSNFPKLFPESCMIDSTLNTYFCSCSTDFCNTEKLIYEKWPMIKANRTMFLPKEILLSNSNLTCYECGIVKLFTNKLNIPCDGRRTCKGTTCVVERKVKNPVAYCRNSWNNVGEVGCKLNKNEGYEYCICNTSMCNTLQIPQTAGNIFSSRTEVESDAKTHSIQTLATTTTFLPPLSVSKNNLASFPELAATRLVRQEVIPTTTTVIAPVTACPICSAGPNPCKNNGTFIITGPDTFICQCPDGTTGANCTTILTCEPGDCSANATCNVFNHKKICSCKPGYTGDPHVACSTRTKRACMVTDPHYTTFDGTTFDYQGTCPYYAMKTCNSDDFSITATNTFSDARKSVSHVSEFTLKTQQHEFRVDSNTDYFIDGMRTYYPNYWPSASDPKVVATKPADKVIIEDKLTGAIITFAKAYLCVDVPLNEFFYGNDSMCGIWGNINDVCNDDVQDKNGKQLVTDPARRCYVGTNMEAFQMMDSWVVDSTINNCVEAAVVLNVTTAPLNGTPACDIEAAQNQCDLIRQAINGQGPFAACKVMGHDVIDKYFHDCAFDICHSFPLCDALNTFALLCNNFPFTNIDNWRDIAKCPYTCPPQSHFSMKTPKCQNSCSDPTYSNSTTCQDGYEQGCTCNTNFYFDSNGEHTGFNYACRALDECGCVDENGNYHPPHSKWLDANCTLETQCNNGNLTAISVTCSADAQCNIVNGFSTCQCDAGYSGDGYTCTDIDECQQDPNMCSGHGNCTNSPGTYNCSCYAPYSGSKCEKYTPSRHCADLQVFHGITKNGTYSITIDANYTLPVKNSDLTWTEVFCDMESNGGGWTLMSHESGSAATKKINCGKTFREYVRGFGDPASTTVWLGLENVHAMTASTPTSLRIIIEQCPAEFAPYQKEECTYLYFSVTDSNNQYAIFLNSSCIGPANGRYDNWITWDRNQVGPKFYAFDEDTPHNCSNTYLQTGWWFNYVNTGDLCGAANLNGIRYACGENEYQYTGKYLSWGNLPVNDAYMYLRPRDFPNYDSNHDNATPPQ